MKLLPDIGYPQSFESVEPGTYACMNCPHDKPDDKSVVILDKKKALPECPVCGATYWMKL